MLFLHFLCMLIVTFDFSIVPAHMVKKPFLLFLLPVIVDQHILHTSYSQHIYKHTHNMQIMFSLLSRSVPLILSTLSPFSTSSSSSSSYSSSSGRHQRTHLLLYVLLILTGYCQLIDAVCDEHHWWQQQLNECIPCTVCDASQSIVLRPCQLHSDTVCGTLDDIEFDLNILRAAAAARAVEDEQVSIQTLHFMWPNQVKVHTLWRIYLDLHVSGAKNIGCLAR